MRDFFSFFNKLLLSKPILSVSFVSINNYGGNDEENKHIVFHTSFHDKDNELKVEVILSMDFE